jgi:subtilisin family serine protease
MFDFRFSRIFRSAQPASESVLNSLPCNSPALVPALLTAIFLLGQVGSLAPAWAEEGVRNTLPDAMPAHRDETFLQGRNPYYVRYASGRSTAVEQAIEASGGRVTHRLDQVETVAVIIPDAAADALARRPDVALVEPVPEHRIAGQVVPWNIDQYQARDIWDKNRDGTVDTGAPDGSGMRFCIIDTGLYASHSDFAGVTMQGFSQIPGKPGAKMVMVMARM